MSSLFARKLMLLAALLGTLLLTACDSTATATPAASSNSAATPVAVTASAGRKLNLNTVTADELLSTIPGFGNRMVREFQEYRPYVSILQFRKEIGKYVDAAQVAEYEKYVYVPIEVNESDAATLQQIPGLTESQANDLIAARPFASNEAFTAKLAEYVSAEAVAVAQTYLSAP
jgi:DNA uptake protein ComE-like DNA-binding protein